MVMIPMASRFMATSVASFRCSSSACLWPVISLMAPTARGDPEEILGAYRQHITARVRAWGGTMKTPLSPRFYRGDGRAEIVGVELAGEDGKPTMAWRSGEPVGVKI